MRTNFVLTTITMSLGFLLVQLDVSVVNVALANIATSIHTGVTGLQWIVDSYALTFASLLLSAGAMGDRIGRAACLRCRPVAVRCRIAWLCARA